MLCVYVLVFVCEFLCVYVLVCVCVRRLCPYERVWSNGPEFKSLLFSSEDHFAVYSKELNYGNYAIHTHPVSNKPLHYHTLMTMLVTSSGWPMREQGRCMEQMQDGDWNKDINKPYWLTDKPLGKNAWFDRVGNWRKDGWVGGWMGECVCVCVWVRVRVGVYVCVCVGVCGGGDIERIS